MHVNLSCVSVCDSSEFVFLIHSLLIPDPSCNEVQRRLERRGAACDCRCCQHSKAGPVDLTAAADSSLIHLLLIPSPPSHTFLLSVPSSMTRFRASIVVVIISSAAVIIKKGSAAIS